MTLQTRLPQKRERNCHNMQKPGADLAHAPTRTHAYAEHRIQGSQQYLSQTVSVKRLGICELSLGPGLAPFPRARCMHPPAAPAPAASWPWASSF